MIRVKICGLNDPAGFDAAVAAGADWLGFVFFARSPRHVTPREAGTLSARYAGGPLRVGLFVEPTDDEIDATLDRIPLNILQLYASPARVAEIGALFDLPVWRAVGVTAAADLPDAMDGAAALLIEAKAPPGSDRPGGNATRFDWSATAGWAAPGPWLLAGGLTPDNVAEAVRTSGATAVDVSSGVESAPGIKDPARIAAFVQAARG